MTHPPNPRARRPRGGDPQPGPPRNAGWLSRCGGFLRRPDRRSAQVLQNVAGLGPGPECRHRHGCLGRYRVPEPGPVLVYWPRTLADRAATRRGHGPASRPELKQVEIQVITAPTLRLDQRGIASNCSRRPSGSGRGCCCWIRWSDCTGLTKQRQRSGRTAAYIRTLQRQLDLSVILVHHTRKNGAAGIAAGQALRGSSDLHAFGDSNLYLQAPRSVCSCPANTAPRRRRRRCTWNWS